MSSPSTLARYLSDHAMYESSTESSSTGGRRKGNNAMKKLGKSAKHEFQRFGRGVHNSLNNLSSSEDSYGASVIYSSQYYYGCLIALVISCLMFFVGGSMSLFKFSSDEDTNNNTRKLGVFIAIFSLFVLSISFYFYTRK